MSPRERLIRHLDESAAVKRRMAASDAVEVILEAARQLSSSVRNGGKIMLCGNGGSAADSQHLAAEFTNRLRSSTERPPIAAIALTTDTSFLTARANDYCFDEVFERLVEGLGRPGDALIGISTSGGSRNVIRAVLRAKERGITTVGLLGGTGGLLADMVDLPIIVPSDSTQHIQECHIAIGHVICELIEESLYGDVR
jgi:D-sedoheptulose 7-phosphate isomerase